MHISIIIAAYKDIEALKLIMEALRKQTYPDFEVVVAEDNNDIKMAEYISSITDLDVKHTTQEDIGIRKARSQNNAILKSTGDYLIFIDGDCIPYTTFIDAHARLAEEGCVLIGRRVNLGPDISTKIRQRAVSASSLEKNYFFKSISLLNNGASHTTQGIYINPTGWLYKYTVAKRRKSNLNILGCNFSCYKKDILAIGGFDESYGETAVPDDTDLQWRLEAIGLKLKTCKLAANQLHLHHTRHHQVRDVADMVQKMQRRKETGNYIAKKGLNSHADYADSVAHMASNPQITMRKKPTAVISFGVLFGGMEMDALKLAKLLCNDTEVTLITRAGTKLDKYCRAPCKELGINVESIPFTYFFSFSIIFGVRSIIKRKHIANVIFFGASEMRSLYFSFLGLGTNLIIRHGMKKTTSKKDILHRLFYSNVNWHVSICEYISSNVNEIIPFGKNSKLKLIYSVLRYPPSDLPEPRIRELNPVKLLHVARIAPGKGQVDAIKTCKVLHDKGIPFELHLVGEIHEPFRNRFESVLASVDYRDSIFVHGFCDNIPDLLRQSDIFFYPSSGEGLSNSFIEALAFGLICITYENTSFPELRELGFIMHIAKHDDLDDLNVKLNDAIDYMKTNPLPVMHNVELAEKLFYPPERELNEYMEILV
jgi:glycosyltransferase involved in cell wall biosynthesis/GT2 family glycosyltransferase